MKSIVVKGRLREEVGKKNSKQLRENKSVPCVMYGQGENIHFEIAEVDFKDIVYTPNSYIVELDLDGKKYKSVIRDLQFHPVNDNILHADFFQINEKEPVWVKLPVRFEGSPVGVLNGGRLVKKMRKLNVKALLKDLPDDVTIDISDLGIGQSINIRELDFDNIEILEPGNSVVVLVKSARGILTDEEEEEEEEGEEGVEGEEGAEGESTENKEASEKSEE